VAQIAVIPRKCDGCGQCASTCPFGAIDVAAGKATLNAACRVCGLCIKACPRQAIVRLETKESSVDKAAWRDILVLCEACDGALHPVSLELVGKARQLCHGAGFQVKAVLIGHGAARHAQELRHYGVAQTFVYDDPALGFFRADAFAACAEDAIRAMKPCAVLVGATSAGRSLAPRLAARFRTGLTADCTALDMRDNTDLVQIRPAFGGNIMAQIITPGTRPQFATVRYRVMDAPAREAEASGEVLLRAIPKAALASPVRHVRTVPVPAGKSISDAQVLVVGGRGLQKEADLSLIRELAALLDGDWAVTRPLVEKGWAANTRQIGLSGRTVRPRLILTFGVSGAIQFTSCMNMSEHIVAVNADQTAPIFDVAHVCVVGDLYPIARDLIARLKEVGA
jgi:electron transfer flavoprotein alpha subunit